MVFLSLCSFEKFSLIVKSWSIFNENIVKIGLCYA